MAVMMLAADLTGSWEFEVQTDAGSGKPRFQLTQKGETLSGKYSGALGEADVTGTVKDNAVKIRFEVSGALVVYSGQVLEDGSMKGSVDIAGQATGTWTGKRLAK